MSEPTANPSATSPSGGADVMLSISHYAVLSGLCQFIPVPFADDLADRQVRKRMVEKLLAARGRRFEVRDVKPLYAGVSSGLLGKAGSVAKGLILKPVKKLLRTVFFIATIRRAILEAADALLLGHTLDRLLADGWFTDDASAERRQAQAVRVEQAVSEVMRSPDRRALVGLVRQSVRRLRGLPPSEVKPTATTPDEVEASLTPEQRRKLDETSGELRQRLESEEGRSVLSRLDAAIDRRLSQP